MVSLHSWFYSWLCHRHLCAVAAIAQGQRTNRNLPAQPLLLGLYSLPAYPLNLSAARTMQDLATSGLTGSPQRHSEGMALPLQDSDFEAI